MILLVLGFCAGLFHFASSQVRLFETAAAADIAQKLQGRDKTVIVRADVGPEALFGDIHSVRIDASRFTTRGLPLYTEPRRSHRGLVRSLHLELHDFTLRDLPIMRLSADIPDCRFDLPLAVDHRKIRISRSGLGAGEVAIGEHDLERFILAKYSEIKRVTVRIEGDKVFVDGYGEFLVVSTNFSVAARLESPDGNQLVLARAKILFDGKPADDALQRVLLDTLNPIVDLDKDLSLFGAIRVDRITLKDGVLTAAGPVKIPDLPQPGVQGGQGN